MDVTFVLEESGVTATVEVPCEANVAEAKEVACTALAVSPVSVEMRIGTQVLEGTCRLQDTAFEAGVQVVLARRLADIKCPAEYTSTHVGKSWSPYNKPMDPMRMLSLSRCGTLCISGDGENVVGFDTETFACVFDFKAPHMVHDRPAISQCKTRCYLPCWEGLFEVALPGGEVVRKVDGFSRSVFSCGSVVVSNDRDGVFVYDEDLTLLRSLSHEGCHVMAVSDCGGWAITSSYKEENVRLWDVNTGEAVACVSVDKFEAMALSRSGSVFAAGVAQVYDWSGAFRKRLDAAGRVKEMQFTPCGKYLVVRVVVAKTFSDDSSSAEFDDEYDMGVRYVYQFYLRQYDVATMSCVRVIRQIENGAFAISPCSRVVVVLQSNGVIVTRHLYPYNSEPDDPDDVMTSTMLPDPRDRI